eukprot:77513-Amphidinium_carterae.1
MGDVCIRCREEAEKFQETLSHTIFRCPHLHKERRQVQFPATDATVAPCVNLHGLLLATGVHTVWTDGSGRHCNDPQHCHCGVARLCKPFKMRRNRDLEKR